MFVMELPELGCVFTYPGSGNSITNIQSGTNQAISTGALNGAGTYVAWQIHLNYEGSLSGRYRVDGGNLCPYVVAGI